jgi:hypothetical protein
VQSSEGRWQCWWFLDEEISAARAANVSHKIAIAHNSQGCDISGWAPGKLLRVPGTSSTKYGAAQPVTVEYSDIVYTIDTVEHAYRDITITHRAVQNDKRPSPVTKSARIKLEQRLDTAGLSDLYLRKPQAGQSWSERLYRLELELFRLDMTPQEVFSIARESASNKYAPENVGETTQHGDRIPSRTDPDGVLWKEVQKAHAEYEDTRWVPVEDEQSTNERPPAEFLSFEERRFCVDHPTFIDEYVAWVAGRSPQSATTYQLSLAWLLLSCVFGSRGYLPLYWGDRELNLWVLIVGDTTLTKKTTAKNLFLYALHVFEAQMGLKIDIGNNITAEGIIKELGTRDGLVSLFSKDEIQGFFSDVIAKQYMTGTIETLTELYDGSVPVTLRATKDTGNQQRARTVFEFLGVGIRGDVARVLTRDFFKSGFLARMLWSVADTPVREKGSEDVKFRDPDEQHFQYDSVLDDFVGDLVTRVRMWPTDKPSPITMDEESLARYNEWAEEAMQVSERYGDDGVIVPSYERMKNSIAVCAALLAMYDQSSIIRLPHVLSALQQAEFWYNDMLKMINEISASGFQRSQDEVENYITTGVDRIRLESSVRRKFARFKPREIEEILSSLKSQGRIRSCKGQKLEAL